jgi:hypothetical protein
MNEFDSGRRSRHLGPPGTALLVQAQTECSRPKKPPPRESVPSQTQPIRGLWRRWPVAGGRGKAPVATNWDRSSRAMAWIPPARTACGRCVGGRDEAGREGAWIEGPCYLVLFSPFLAPPRRTSCDIWELVRSRACAFGNHCRPRLAIRTPTLPTLPTLPGIAPPLLPY